MKYKIEALIVLVVLASVMLIKFSGFSINNLVMSQVSILSKVILDTYGMTPEKSLKEVAKPYVVPLLSVVLISISMGLMSLIEDTKKKIILSFLCSLIPIIIFKSYLGVFLGISIFLSFIISTKSTNLSIVVFNIILAIGIFFSISGNLSFYESQLTEGLNDFVGKIVTTETTSLKNVTYQIGVSIINQEESALIYSVENENIPNKEMVIADIRNAFENVRREFERKQGNIDTEPLVDEVIEQSRIFSAFVRWLPFSVALQVWIFLEFLRALILKRIAEIPKIIKKKKS